MMMMGHGSNGYGGSSSSPSNLSALAPPFTVDRSVPKSGSNPLVDLTEITYGLTYNHSLHNWHGLQTPNSSPDYFSCTEIEFHSVPSSNAYRYSSSIEHVAPLNPLISASIDTDINGQSSNTLLEAKPYYPSYVSNAIGNCSPLDIRHNSGYDLLPTSQVPTVNNSLHEDYAESLSGLENSAHWSECLEGLTDWQHARPVQLDGSFYSKENYFNQGLYESEDMVNFEEASYSSDTVSMEKETKSGFRGQRDYESLVGEIPKFVSSVCPTSTSSASSLQVPETCPRLESLVSSWSHQMPYGASYEKCLRKHDATTNDMPSVINSSPANFIGPIVQDTSLFRNTNATNEEKYEDFPSNSPCVVMERLPYVSSNLNVASSGDFKVFSSNNSSFFLDPDPSMSSKSSVRYDASQASFCNEENEKVISGFPSGKNKGLSRNETPLTDSLDQVHGKKSGIQVPHASPNISIIVGDKNEEVKNYLENVDCYNPVVDSPCWRGAPVSHFSKYEVSEAFCPQSTKKEEACGGPNLKAHPVCDHSRNDPANVSPEKTSKKLMRQEIWSRESSLAHSLKTLTVDNILLREENDDAAKAEPCYTNPVCFDGVKIADDSLSKNDFDTKLPHKEQHGCEGDEWTNKKRCAASISVTNVGMNNDDPDDFSSQVALNAIEHVLFSPQSMDDAPSRFIEPHGRESTQKMYFRTMIDAMQNLSELLVFHLSSDASELKKDDCEALKDVIHNLDLCINRTVERPERVTSPVLGDSSNHQKDSIKNGSRASGIHPSNVHGPVKYQLVKEEDCSSVSGRKDEKLSNFVAGMSVGDISKDDSMTEALRKALVKSFGAEEETDPHVLLYKNLWLEAEAALCSASCIARFSQMKNEMENHNSETNRKTMIMEKLSKSEVSFNPDAANTLSSGAKGCPLPDSSIPKSSFSRASSLEDALAARRIDNSNTKNTPYADMLGNAMDKLSTREDSLPWSAENLACEVQAVVQKPCMPSNASNLEDSVMARFHILKCRDDSLISMDAEGPRQSRSFLDRSEDRVSHAKMECDLKSPIEDKVDLKEYHQNVEGNRMNISRMLSKAGDQSRTALGDGSSDWEHVLLEELIGLGR